MRERSGHKPARLYESERAVKERSFTFLEFSLNASRVESVLIKIALERRVAGAARFFNRVSSRQVAQRWGLDGKIKYFQLSI